MANLVVLDQPIGHFEDRGSRPVVVDEPNGFRSGPIVFEIQNVFDSDAGRTVNRLIIVPDDAQVAVTCCEGSHDFVLGVVGVLVFVDQDVVEAGGFLLATFGN